MKKAFDDLEAELNADMLLCIQEIAELRRYIFWTMDAIKVGVFCPSYTIEFRKG
jgi:hypothetical protein